MPVRTKRSITLYTIWLSILILASVGYPASIDYRFSSTSFGISPDGTRIAYPVHDYDEYGEPITHVWTAKLNGSGKRETTSLNGVLDVRWNNNSSLVTSYLNRNKIEIMPLKGKPTEIAIPDVYQWADPTISPDGKWAAFSAYQTDKQKMGVFILDIKTGNIKKIAADPVKSYVSWSPDSKKLAYGEGYYVKDYRLKILDIATGKVTDTGKNGVGVRWSADGKWLAFTGNAIRGGSWLNGIPLDGSIVKMNVETGAITVLTESGVNVYDKDSGHWEISGAFEPKWSPNGKLIAFERSHTISEGKEKKLSEDELWVMNADGSNARKLTDRAPYIWAPDNKSILIKTSTGIKRIEISTGKTKDEIEWPLPKVPEMKTEALTVGSCSVTYTGVRPEYANALARIADEARNFYAESGFDIPAKMMLTVKRVDGNGPQLWTDGDSSMFLNITSVDDLAPPTQGGAHNIYGMCHELGHMVMYRKINMIGLPDGVGQGWAHYVGSVVIDHVYRKLGKDVWPIPYNYAEVEGTARLAEQFAKPDPGEPSDSKAARVFYEAQQKYGETKVLKAMKAALDAEPWGKDLMSGFVDQLVKLSGDESARALVPDEMLNPKIKWTAAEREINEETTEGESQAKDETGVTLSYDDGKSDGMRSSSGAGEAVMFASPSGSWAVDSIQLYGSRYGEVEPPKENFYIFICDKDFNVIKTIVKPYSTFENSDPRWYTIAFDPVRIPSGFYVCVYFNPTATKGVFVHYDKDIAKSHSRYALPWTFVNDLGQGSKWDWMIRTHLVTTTE